jgi:hypothetical protein
MRDGLALTGFTGAGSFDTAGIAAGMMGGEEGKAYIPEWVTGAMQKGRYRRPKPGTAAARIHDAQQTVETEIERPHKDPIDVWYEQETARAIDRDQAENARRTAARRRRESDVDVKRFVTDTDIDRHLNELAGGEGGPK